ncbi:hypothetical protein TRVA0_043S00276 [Trichomonascus vanleenenianus]|uniref:DsbA family protein n=1 Tax=Trichomonascus vanleenenianus TaxID=2268995 RepID=UPI003EC9F7DE
MFRVIYDQVLPNATNTKFIFRHQIQPWHPTSTIVHEAAIAVGVIAGPEAYWKFSSALFDESEKYYDEPTYNKTRKQLYEELSVLAEKSVGVDKFKLLDALAITNTESRNAGNKVTDDIKYFIKFARQNSIHVSPTVLVDGLVDNSISSSWTNDDWAAKLTKL